MCCAFSFGRAKQSGSVLQQPLHLIRGTLKFICPASMLVVLENGFQMWSVEIVCDYQRECCAYVGLHVCGVQSVTDR